jgi:hypothetical protein
MMSMSSGAFMGRPMTFSLAIDSMREAGVFVGRHLTFCCHKGKLSMLRSSFALSIVCAAFALGCGEDDDSSTDTENLENGLGFFVTSETNATGDLGGLAGADEKCEELAAAVGAGGRTWRAYLSADDGGNGQPVNARDRIGEGPWRNADGDVVAEDLDALHELTGNAELFIDENGDPINGQWNGSNGMDGNPVNEHDILTGSDPDGNLAEGFTCDSWNSSEASTMVMMPDAMGMMRNVCTENCAKVGHSDGMGPMMNMMAPFNSWNSAHDNAGCNDTAPRGGAGRFYCFAAD